MIPPIKDCISQLCGNAAWALGFSREECDEYYKRPHLLWWLLLPVVGWVVFWGVGLRVRSRKLTEIRRCRRSKTGKPINAQIGERLSKNYDAHKRRLPSDRGAGGRY